MLTLDRIASALPDTADALYAEAMETLYAKSGGCVELTPELYSCVLLAR